MDAENNFIEQVQVNGSLYEKVIVSEQDDLPGREVAADVQKIPEQLAQLLDPQDLEEVGLVTIKEAEGNTMYTVILNDSFSEQVTEKMWKH